MQLKPLEEIRYIPLRVRHDRVYYFVEDGRIHTRPISRAPEKIKDYYREMYRNEFLYVKRNLSEEEYINKHLRRFSIEERDVADYKTRQERVSLQLRKAMARLKEGDSYEALQRYLDESVKYYEELYRTMVKKRGVFHDKPKGLDRFIIKIVKPIILRIPENDNPNTFDIIKVQMDIISQWETDRIEYGWYLESDD